MAIDLLGILLTGQPDFRCVNNNDVIARVNEWRPRGFVLAHQQPGSLSGKFAQHDVVRVDHMPVSFNSLFRGEYGTHEHTTPIDSETRKSFSKSIAGDHGSAKPDIHRSFVSGCLRKCDPGPDMERMGLYETADRPRFPYTYHVRAGSAAVL
jgi:hypothetical protein